MFEWVKKNNLRILCYLCAVVLVYMFYQFYVLGEYYACKRSFQLGTNSQTIKEICAYRTGYGAWINGEKL